MGRPGRPTKLDDRTADELVRLVAAGSTFEAAAEAIGVTPRAVRGWRRRAWSARPEDQRFVRLERRLVEALAVRREPPALDLGWETAARALEHQHPERWSLPAEPLDEWRDDPLDAA